MLTKQIFDRRHYFVLSIDQTIGKIKKNCLNLFNMTTHLRTTESVSTNISLLLGLVFIFALHPPKTLTGHLSNSV